MSRNAREGRYFGKWRRRHRRGMLDQWGIPLETKECDWLATRKERRQHNKNRSLIRRLGRAA